MKQRSPGAGIMRSRRRAAQGVPQIFDTHHVLTMLQREVTDSRRHGYRLVPSDRPMTDRHIHTVFHQADDGPGRDLPALRAKKC